MHSVEIELATINQRLNYIASRLPQPATANEPASLHATPVSDGQLGHLPITNEEKSPFQLLGAERTMVSLGLEPGFAQTLLHLEKASPSKSSIQVSRLRLMQQKTGHEALAAFSAHLHLFYPIFRPGFSQSFLEALSGSLAPSSESLLVLTVAAVGLTASQDFALGGSCTDDAAAHCVEAAASSLPHVITDGSLVSVQGLLLLSMYHCCMLQPIRAYDYIVIASIKVQNLVKTLAAQESELTEQIRRTFWAVLLMECELQVQFDVVGSGISNQDDDIALPDSRQPWQSSTEGNLTCDPTSPAISVQSTASDEPDKVQSYFLAEIAMRRMLNRCNTAIRRDPEGHIVYAPGIAMELELQLENWYTYLPGSIRFDYEKDLDFDLLASPSLYPRTDSLSNFLRAQYYCCKVSIYWPAAYQCIQDGCVTSELSQHCERFFNAYIQLMPSILLAVRECMLHRWTLFASIFMTSMAVLKAASTVGIQDGCAVDWARLYQCLQSTQRVDQRIAEGSASLSLLSQTLSARLQVFWDENNIVT